ncbi:MAG: hypothetical protein ABWY82_20470 [Tardiphaga sp.]
MKVAIFTAGYFSTRTPLNFFAGVFFLAFLMARNSPVSLSRFVNVVAPAMVVFVWLRFFTAPLRALSPVGLLTAMISSCAAGCGYRNYGRREIWFQWQLALSGIRLARCTTPTNISGTLGLRRAFPN